MQIISQNYNWTNCIIKSLIGIKEFFLKIKIAGVQLDAG